MKKAIAVLLAAIVTGLVPGADAWRAAAQTGVEPVSTPLAPGTASGVSGASIQGPAPGAGGPLAGMRSLALPPALAAVGSAPVPVETGAAQTPPAAASPQPGLPSQAQQPKAQGHLQPQPAEQAQAPVNGSTALSAPETKTATASEPLPAAAAPPVQGEPKEPVAAKSRFHPVQRLLERLKRSALLASGSFAMDPATLWPHAAESPGSGWTGKGALARRLAAKLLDGKLRPAERAKAAEGLGKLRRIDAAPALGEAALHAEDEKVRAAASRAMGLNAARWTASAARKARWSPFSRRREEAVRVLGWIARATGRAAALDALAFKAALDSKEAVRLAAIEELARLGGGRARSALRWLAEHSDEPGIRSTLELAGYPAAADPGAERERRQAVALKRALLAGAVFFSIEFMGSIVTRSLALRADSIHMAADWCVSAATLAGLHLSRRPPSSRNSFGPRRIEAVIGLASAAAIFLTAVEITREAAARLAAPQAQAVATDLAMIIALAGLASNVITTLLLYRFRDESVSMKGAFLHSATDAAGSVAIIAAGLLTLAFGWLWTDAAICFLVVAFILHSAWEVLAPSWNILMEGVPPGLDLDAVEADLLELPGVEAVDDLRAWSLGSSERALTARVRAAPEADRDAIVQVATALLRERHGIRRSTLQVEGGGGY